MDSGGKSSAPANGLRNNNAGPGGIINVQPPRREDLQPSYAQIVKGESEDAGTHGWYGSMSIFTPFIISPDFELIIR